MSRPTAEELRELVKTASHDPLHPATMSCGITTTMQVSSCDGCEASKVADGTIRNHGFSSPQRALAYAALLEACEAWQASDDHHCDECEERGYGTCKDSVDLTLFAALKQAQALATHQEGS